MKSDNLKVAVAALEDIRSRMRCGERVAPSRVTLYEYGDRWLSSQTQLRPRSVEKYRSAIELHIGPLLGRTGSTRGRTSPHRCRRSRRPEFAYSPTVPVKVSRP